jgi:outer membrane receptor protein involved in Fe transport
MKNFTPLVLVALFLLAALALDAQNKSIALSGKVVDSSNGQAIEFASILLSNANTKAPISGTTTDIEGQFTIASPTPDFQLEVSFIGYQSKTIESFTIENGQVKLGTISLSANTQTLDEVIVRAEKSQTEFQLDKRVFNVGKDLSSTGASALEVLNNVPSVNVNIEGEISLRGSSGVQILINGKPSVIASEQGSTLGTITADMIDKIEVITNPSAKYDAEGTSGIINIVIKKEERKGLNGSVSVNTGTPHNHSVGISLNRRTEHFNLFSQLGVGFREIPTITENINEDLVNDTITYSQGKEFRNETFYNVVLGTDYHINPRNILTLSGNFAYEVEDQPSFTNFTQVLGSDTLSQWYRDETTEATNPKWRYELQYKSDLKGHEDHMLLFSALGNFFGKDQSSEFENVATSGDKRFEALQRSRTDFKEAKYTFMLDYTKPFNDQFTLETGAQYVMMNVSNDFENSTFADNVWVIDSSLTNIFEFDQKVLGVYGTGAYENDKWGIKLGLRMENTDLQTLLVTTDEANDQNYTNFFPTAHTSYKLTDNFSIQAGYSRRVYRPRLWDLNPFFNIRNTISVRTGNPNLQPEFTDSYELASIYIVGKTSMNFTVYHRYTTDMIERVSIFENNINTFKPINLGSNRTTGLEFNFKYSPKKWLSFNGDLNFNYFDRKGSFEGQNFDFQADQWSSKTTAKLKLPADIDFEVTGQYQSSVKTVQGVTTENLFADMGIRKKILKGKGVLNFSIRDIFASRIRENQAFQPTFYTYSFRQRGRFVTLGFSYGFGKGEAMEYSGRKRYH